MAKIVGDTDARQATRGRTVLYVLVGGLILAAVYLASMLMWSGATSPPSASQPVAPAGPASSAAPPGSASSTTSNVPAGNPAYPVPAAPSASPAPARP